MRPVQALNQYDAMVSIVFTNKMISNIYWLDFTDDTEIYVIELFARAYAQKNEVGTFSPGRMYILYFVFKSLVTD